MNNHITLDDLNYHTPFKEWNYITRKIATVRYTLLGSTDATYAPPMIYTWIGKIEAPSGSAPPWGGIYDLRWSLSKLTAITFVDHYGTTFSVHAMGEFPEDSMSPGWDGDENIFRVNVRLIGT